MKEYTLLRKKRKTVAISITPSLEIVIKVPLRYPENLVLPIVEKHANWIEKNLEKQRIQNSLHPKKNLQENDVYFYLGKPIVLQLANVSKVYVKDDFLFCPSVSLRMRKQLITNWYSKETALEVAKVLGDFSSVLKARQSGFSVTNANRQWGSCTPQNKLNFSWRLSMLPESLLNYVVVHELAHTIHHNHSRNFWKKVSEVFPNWKVLRAELRRDSQKYRLV